MFGSKSAHLPVAQSANQPMNGSDHWVEGHISGDSVLTLIPDLVERRWSGNEYVRGFRLGVALGAYPSRI